jgi:hypothetical protein
MAIHYRITDPLSKNKVMEPGDVAVAGKDFSSFLHFLPFDYCVQFSHFFVRFSSCMSTVSETHTFLKDIYGLVVNVCVRAFTHRRFLTFRN